MKARIGGLMVLAIVVVLAVAGMLHGTGNHGENPPMESEVNQVTANIELGVAMSLWYGAEHPTGVSRGGLGTDHWNSGVVSGTGLHDSVAVTPEHGFYSSDDPEVIAKQISRMRDIGVSWIMTHWWGWGDNNVDTTEDDVMRKAIDRAHTDLFDHLESLDGSIKAFIAMDNWMTSDWRWEGGPVLIDEQVSQVIWDRIHEHYVEKYPVSYYHLEGKPLVVSWAPHVLHPDTAERFTYKKMWPITFADPRRPDEMDWSWLSPITDPINYKKDIISNDGMVKIDARFDQYFSWILGYQQDPPHRLDPFLTEGVYDRNWELIHEAHKENNDTVKLILIGTWNDYHEQSQIEPSYNGQFGTGTLLIDKTKHYWSRLRAGQSFQSYSSNWLEVWELKQTLGNPDYRDMGFDTSVEFDRFLERLIERSQSHVAKFLNRDFRQDTDPVPQAVEESTLRLAGNLYHYTLKVKRGELYRLGELDLRLIDDSVFTESLRRDLAPWRRTSGIKVIFP